MPRLRCLDEDCGETFEERSRLAEGGDCIACGGPTEVVGRDDIEPAEPSPPPYARGVAQRKRHVRDAAAQLLRKHSITKVPVLVAEIADREGYAVVEREGEDLGSLSARTVDDVIEVRAGDPNVRKRFSIAHELGHCILGTTHGRGGPMDEADANLFAGSLLVPPKALGDAFVRTRNKGDLALIFEVSRQVIEIAVARDRLGDLVG